MLSPSLYLSPSLFPSMIHTCFLSQGKRSGLLKACWGESWSLCYCHCCFGIHIELNCYEVLMDPSLPSPPDKLGLSFGIRKIDQGACIGFPSIPTFSLELSTGDRPALESRKPHLIRFLCKVPPPVPIPPLQLQSS